MERIAVMGAGGIGCYYGGMLARAGHKVTHIGRPQHVEAMQRAGLRFQTKERDEHVPVDASSDAAAVRGAKLILFCVKSQDTETAGKTLVPHLERETVIITLQNGVDNAERLSRLLGREVLTAAVYAAVEMAGPGHVRHHGRGELVIGRGAASADVARILTGAGVPVELSDNISGVMWAKLIANCAYNALSAITQLPYGRLVQGAGIPAVMRGVVDECLAVAHAAGITVPGDQHEAVRRIALTMAEQYSSTAQDLARGKKTEIEHLNGVVVRKGEALGVATPVNRTLLALVQVLEGRKASG